MKKLLALAALAVISGPLLASTGDGTGSKAVSDGTGLNSSDDGTDKPVLSLLCKTIGLGCSALDSVTDGTGLKSTDTGTGGKPTIKAEDGTGQKPDQGN